MSECILTAEELLGGARITREVTIPPEVLRPAGNEDSMPEGAKVVLKPLTVKDIQLISKAAREDETIVSALMIQQALVKPELTHGHIMSMHGGLVEFLVDTINTISGLKTDRQFISEAIQSPFVKACFILSKEFGWTPKEISEMTIGQILLYLETINSTANDEK